MPFGNRLPKGLEIQMPELDWVKLHTRNGKVPPIAYVHGELFGAGGLKAVPDNPAGQAQQISGEPVQRKRTVECV